MSIIKVIFFFSLIVSLFGLGCSSDEDKKASHFEKGLVYFENSDYKSARLEFKNAIQIDSQYLDAYQKLGETNLILGDLRGAFRSYSMVAEGNPEHIEAQVKLATFLLLAKKTEDSRKKVDLVLHREPDNIDALLLLGAIYAQDNKFIEAEVTFNKVLKIDRYQVRAYLGLSRVLAALGKSGEAESTLQQAVDIEPKSLKIRLALFNLYLQAARFDRAEILMKEIIADNPENDWVHVVLGNFYVKLTKPDHAEAAYLKAVEISPANIRNRMILADFYAAAGKNEKTLEVCFQALEIESDNIQVMHALAGHYVKQGNVEEAEKQIAEILARRRSYFPTRMLKGELLIRKRKFEAALELFSQLIEEQPGATRAYYFKGLAHFGMNDTNSAKTALFKAVELDAALAKARLLLAEIYLRNHDFALAQEQATHVLLTRPRDYQAWLLLGNAYMYQNKIAEADDTFKSLIETAPDNPMGYYRLGVLQRRLHQYDAAMDNFEKAMSINPKLIDVFTNIIRVQAARGEYTPALKRCDRQLQQYNDSPALAAVVYNLKGDLYLAQGNKAAATESFQTAIRQNPDFLRPYYALAEIYLGEHQEKKAIARYKGLLEVNPKEVQAHMLLGVLYDRQKRYELSEAHYRAALEVKPEFAAAANNLAYILADQDKDIDEALRLARMAKEKLPNSPYVMDTLGWAYYKKGLYPSAIGEFSGSLAKIPDNPAVAYHLGMAYYKIGDASNARFELEKALSLDENFGEAAEARRVLAEL